MASSSRPFQSQTVARLLAGYRQIAHGAERLLRQGQTALLWGVQVMAFPLYVAIQGMRSAARTLAATKPWQQVVALLTGEKSQPMILSADSPIQALLSITQSLAVREAGGLAPVEPPSRTVGDLLRQSRADGIIVADPGSMVPLQTPVCGIASDLATRHLVLVTANNVIFNGLTDLQREQLQRAITLLMAEYARWCRRQWHDRQLQSPGLPLPQAAAHHWLPVRWFNQALAWMQTSPIAQVTNVFGEAQPSLPAGVSAGENSLMRWWDQALAGPWRPTFPESSPLALEAGANSGLAFMPRPYPAIPVPYGLSGWDRSAESYPESAASEPWAHTSALTVAGVSSMAPQPKTTREVTPYGPKSGAVVATAASPGTIEGGATGSERPWSVDGWTAEDWAVGRGVTPGQARVGDTWDDPDPWGKAPNPKGLPGNDAIEAQATLVNYVDHPLVTVLRWLDALLHRAETWLQRAWRWLVGHP